MSLAEHLAATRRLTDFPALALLLGFDPTWQPIGFDSLRLPVFDGARAAIVGRHGGIVMLGLEGPDPAVTARRAATLLARRGAVTLVAAIDPEQRCLALSAAAADCPVATIQADRIRRIDLEVVERGRQATGPSPFARLLGWAEALSGRSLDDRFFRQFRDTLAAMSDALPRSIPPRDRHALALLDLTRVLFLYFVQARGWLDGRGRFLREELDRVLAEGGRVDRRLFAPLFFGTLNRPADRRTARARQFGQVPFLNGGLFEAHPLERRWTAPLPDAAWRDAFDDLFERYHFTLAADGPPGAIGPDMLGRVFEGVMDPESRRGSGAFYTPAPLVDMVVGESLTRWIASRLGCSETEGAAQLEHPSAATLGWIRGMAVVDPAVGSGAFLLGALRRLVGVRVAGGESRGSATRAVIATNLFGVDRNPNAVHLAELRLWLEVIEADAEAEPDQIAPLPNLDALIRQGDSVLGRLDLPFAIRPTPADDLGKLRASVVKATGPGKRAAVTALRKAELRAARGALDAAIAGQEAAIHELLSTGRSRSLFGDRVALSGSNRTALGRLRADRARLRVIRRRLLAAGELPWFHYGSQFGDVIGRGGFDLVVGNPPWVRAESLTGPEREALKRRFRWFRASPTGRPGFSPLPDLSVAFLERGFDLLAPDGVLGFVMPAKLLTAQYGAAARGALAREHRIHLVRDLADTDHGFDAVVYPLVLVASRGAPAADHAIVARGERRVPQRALGSDPWDLGLAGAAEIRLRAAARRHPTIADRFRIRLGVKTGADQCFLDPPDSLDPRWVRPALRGRDIGAFRAMAVRTILWAHDDTGQPVATIPTAVSSLLSPHLRRLRARSDQRGHPPWALFRIEAGLGRHRVDWPDLARELRAAALVSKSEQALVPLNTCYAIVTDDASSALALTAWLNAEPIRRLAKRRATVAAAGFSRFNAELVGRLPCPERMIGDERLVEIARAARRGELDQAALDRCATELLEGEAG